VPQLMTVKRSLLREPPQPIRVAMDESKLAELADSIRRYGIILPIAVTSVESGYEIVDGHRRYVASGMVGLSEVQVVVFDSVDDAKFGMMLDANICREDITAAEEGLQFLQVAEVRGWGVEKIMEHFGKSEDYINQRVSLVQKFPDLVGPVAERRINWSQAKQIMRCTDANHRAYLVDQAETHGATARTLTYMVDQWKSQALVAAGGAPVHTPEHGQPVVVAVNPKCTWCTRDDDPANIVQIPVHSYHRRDLETFLDRVGINRPAPATAG
jgi:ParB family transcriptional regulator, chromosome partitioning protein